MGFKAFFILLLFVVLVFQHQDGFQSAAQGSFARTSGTGTQFVEDGRTFYLNGFNAYWLMLKVVDPSEREKVTSVFQEASSCGMNVARTWAFNDGGYRSVQYKPGSYNEDMFKAANSGYMAPEYLMLGELSMKANVFSYGVLVLELISGKKNSSFYMEPDVSSLLEWTWKLYTKGRSLEIMDPTLVSTGATDQVGMCIQIAFLSVQCDPKLRPSMQRMLVSRG